MRLPYGRLIGYLSVLILIGALSLGCSGDNDDNNVNPTPDEDEYYVKYEIEAESIYITTKYAEFVLENNTSTTFNFGSEIWEVTIGPVKKGFNARLKGGYITPNLNNSYINAKIHVSKNNGPFALKKFDLSNVVRSSVEINYTIDF